MTTVFHRGELLIQAESGVDKRTHKLGNKLIRDHIIDQHKEFFEGLSYAFVALHDNDAKPWISLVQGPAGFINSPDQKTLNLTGDVIAGDALGLQTNEGEPIGVVGLDLSTRRRNRLNGNLNGGSKKDYLSISVEHSFGNCPKYIQARSFENSFEEQNLEDPQQSAVESFTEFDERDIALIKKSDTLFIASAEKPGGNLDASHRGGRPGFLHVENNTHFWFNDYPGNNYFQTFGNIQNHPYIGLMLIDFETGNLLLMSGEARLVKTKDNNGEPDKDLAFLARRCYFTLNKGLRVKRGIKGKWSDVELSPFLGDDLD